MGQTTISVGRRSRPHAAKHSDLRGIFLAEEGVVRLGGDEQLGHNGSHAAKVARARGAIETAAEASTSTKVAAPEVKALPAKEQKPCGAFGLGQGAVARKVRGNARNPRWAELSRIDEDAHGHRVA